MQYLGVEDTISAIFDKIPNNLMGKIAIKDGELVLLNSTTDKEKEWAADIGILDSVERIEILSIPVPEKPILSRGLTIKVSNDGIITLDGKITDMNNRKMFIRITDKVSTASSYNEFDLNKETIVGRGKNIAFMVEPIDGQTGYFTGTRDDPNHEFKVLLRNEDNEKDYEIDVLNGYFGISKVTVRNMKYAYIFIKGDLDFHNYQFRVKLLEEVEENDLAINPLQVTAANFDKLVEMYGISLEVTPQYTIKLHGTVTEPVSKRLYILLSKNTHTTTDATSLAKYIDITNHLITDDKKAKLEVQEISGSVTVPKKEGQFNVLLRGNNGSDTLSGIDMVYKNKEGQLISDVYQKLFNCKIGSNIYSAEGTLDNGPCTAISLYMTEGVVFDHYEIKPILTVE